MATDYRLLSAISSPFEVDAAVDGLEAELAAAAADGAGQATAAVTARDRQREVALDLAVEGRGLDLGAQARGQAQLDAAVDGVEFQPARPVGATHRGRDRAV